MPLQREQYNTQRWLEGWGGQGILLGRDTALNLERWEVSDIQYSTRIFDAEGTAWLAMGKEWIRTGGGRRRSRCGFFEEKLWEIWQVHLRCFRSAVTNQWSTRSERLAIDASDNILRNKLHSAENKTIKHRGDFEPVGIILPRCSMLHYFTPKFLQYFFLFPAWASLSDSCRIHARLPVPGSRWAVYFQYIVLGWDWAKASTCRVTPKRHFPSQAWGWGKDKARKCLPFSVRL